MKKSGCLPLFLIIVLGLSLFGNLLLFLALGSKGSGPAKAISERKFSETLISKGVGPDKIALIRLDGLITFGRGGRMDGNMADDLKEAFQ